MSSSCSIWRSVTSSLAWKMKDLKKLQIVKDSQRGTEGQTYEKGLAKWKREREREREERSEETLGEIRPVHDCHFLFGLEVTWNRFLSLSLFPPPPSNPGGFWRIAFAFSLSSVWPFYHAAERNFSFLQASVSGRNTWANFIVFRICLAELSSNRSWDLSWAQLGHLNLGWDYLGHFSFGFQKLKWAAHFFQCFLILSLEET